MKKRTNWTNKLKVPPFPVAVLLILIGFGAGYTAKEYIIPPHAVVTQQPPSSSPSLRLKEGATSVCFTPNKQCQSQIINEINKAKHSIYLQAYSFTDREISEALVRAVKRGVNVKLLLDKSNQNDKRSAKDMILQNGIPLRFDSPSGIAHNKVMVLDQSIIITGSYNFSISAYRRNTENLLIINDKALAQQYIKNWLKRWDISKEGVNFHG